MTHHVTFSIHAEHPPPINLIVCTRLAVYNSKSSKPNGLASPFKRKDLATSAYLASLMAQSSFCCSSCQNPHDSKDELAGGTPTKDSNRCIPAQATTRASTPAILPVVAPFVAFGSANSSMVRYSKDNLQQILGIVLDFRPPTPVPAPIVAATPHHEGPHERCLKAWFPDIYYAKTHLECYRFFQQCKDYFATAGTTGANRVLFMAIFLKNTALFRWQQYQHKIEDQINVPISWEGFKAFFC